MKPIHIPFSRFYNWLAIVLLGLGLIWILASRVGETDRQQSAIPQPHEGFTAPNFEFSDLAGNVQTLSALRGQPVIVNFWASWCPPCRTEMPAIQAVHQAYKAQGLVILGVNAADQDNFNQAQDFINDTGLTFLMLYDSSGAIQNLFEVSALPTTFFIDRSGIIQEVIYGGPVAEALLAIHAEELLQERP